jgi:sulfonate transport system permease protein
MTATLEQGVTAAPPRRRIARWARPGLGLVLPVGLAVLWEIAVRMGLSNGRLLPPPSVIFNTFADLARTGELQQHAAATLWRVGWDFYLASPAERSSARWRATSDCCTA